MAMSTARETSMGGTRGAQMATGQLGGQETKVPSVRPTSADEGYAGFTRVGDAPTSFDNTPDDTGYKPTPIGSKSEGGIVDKAKNAFEDFVDSDLDGDGRIGDTYESARTTSSATSKSDADVISETGSTAPYKTSSDVSAKPNSDTAPSTGVGATSSPSRPTSIRNTGASSATGTGATGFSRVDVQDREYATA